MLFSCAEDRGHNAGSQPEFLPADNNKRCDSNILWIIAPMLIIVLSFIPVLYELQEIKKKVVSVTPPTADSKLKGNYSVTPPTADLKLRGNYRHGNCT